MSPTVISPSSTPSPVTTGRVTTPASCIRFQPFFKDIFLFTPGILRISMSFTWVRTSLMSSGSETPK